MRYRTLIAASILTLVGQTLQAQRGAHDSITVTRITFPGLTNVPVDDLRRGLFTRPSTCRLPFLAPICARGINQITSDRRRTTGAALGEDITKLRVALWQRGYRHASVDTVLTAGRLGTAVAFVIVEGEPTRVASIDVTQRAPVLDEKELKDIVELHEGDPFSIIALDSTLAHLKAAIWNKGYADVRIDTIVPRADSARRVPIRIDIDPRYLTRVGSVDFEGNEYLSDATLRRGVVLQPGTLYTRDAVLESQMRLFKSPAIARAVVVTPAGGDSVKAIRIDVSEMPQRLIETTLGFNTTDYGQASILARHNSLGAGRWISVRAAVGNLLAGQLNGQAIFRRALPDDAADPEGFLDPTYQATLVLTQPWIGSARTSSALTLFAGRRSVPNVTVDEDIGASLGVVHELAPRTPIGLSYKLETTRVSGSAIYYCAGFGVCDGSTRAALQRTQRLAPVAVSAWVDRSDDLEVPTVGYTGVVDAEHASAATGSQFAHNRISADAAWYRSFGARRVVAGVGQPMKVLALHFRGGYVKPLNDRAALGVGGAGDGILHPRARFYAGGMQSVRGFAENELGPTILQVRRSSLTGAGCTDSSIDSGACNPAAVPSNEFFARPVGGSSLMEASVELRQPLGKALIGVVFLDGAYVGAAGINSPAHGRGAVTPGGGFRYRSPLGVLRLDLGIRPVGARMLPVVVATTDDRIVRLAQEKRYSPIEQAGTLRKIARRLVVHFAMGQAF